MSCHQWHKEFNRVSKIYNFSYLCHCVDEVYNIEIYTPTGWI